MTGRYLTDMADVLRGAGLSVVELDGWQTRARSSGGYASGAPVCVMWHHTASAGDGAADAQYCTFGSSDRPVCNLVIGRDGIVYVCAAGATNTNGKGGPMTLPSGATIPTDSLNVRAIGIEFSNNGTGMPWPAEQLDVGFAASNALAAAYLGGRFDDIAGHVDWTTRKIDPATAAAVQGAWRPGSTNSSGSWNVRDTRAECLRRADSTNGGFLMALTDDEQRWMLNRMRGCTPGPESGQPNNGTRNLNDADGTYLAKMLEAICTQLGIPIPQV